MGRKKYKKRKNKKPSGQQPQQIAPEERETLAEAALSAGHFRQARDHFHILFKTDEARYHTRLVDACVGLAQLLASKGKTSQASNMIAKVRELDPERARTAFGLQLALTTRDWEAVHAAAAHQLSARNSTTSNQPAAAADALVAAGVRPTPDSGLLESDRHALDAVLDALDALAVSRFDAVRDALRPIPRSSAFAAWKILLKALTAFHQGDAPKACLLFEQLDTGTPAAIAASYLSLCAATTPAPATDPIRITSLCRIAGRPDLGPALARAESAWHKNQHIEAYRALRATAEGFPSEKPNLHGALTHLFATILDNVGDQYGYDFANKIEHYASPKNAKNPAEIRLASRILARCFTEEHHLVRRSWETVARLYKHTAGDDSARLASMVDCHLGKLFAAPSYGFGFPFSRSLPRMLNASWAIELLRRSIQRDPTNLEAHLALIDAYETLKQTSERNAALDTATSTFPDERPILLRAGNNAVERKAFIKGIEYLERAVALDTLDQTSLEDLALALNQAAYTYYYDKGKPQRARSFVARLLEIAHPPGGTSVTLGTEFILARQSVIERSLGFGELADSLEQQAYDRATSEATISFYFARLTEQNSPPSGNPYRTRFDAASKEPLPPQTCAVLANVFSVFAHGSKKPAPLRWEGKAVTRCLRATARHEVIPRETAADILETLGSHPEIRSARRAIIDAGLATDPDDPLFKLHRFIDRKKQPANLHADLRLFEGLEAEARKRNDRLSLPHITFLLEGLKRHADRPPAALPFGDDGFGDDFSDDFSDADIAAAEAAFLASISAGEASPPPRTPPSQLDLF